MPSHFLTYRGNGSAEVPGDGSECLTRGNAARNLLALAKAQDPRGTTTFGWRNAASALKYAIKVGGSLAQRTPDPEDRLAGPVSAPEFFALSVCWPASTISSAGDNCFCRS